MPNCLIQLEGYLGSGFTNITSTSNMFFFWKQVLQGLANQTQFSYMLNLIHNQDGLSTIRNQNNCPILFLFSYLGIV
jgi:hypothetical protein